MKIRVKYYVILTIFLLTTNINAQFTLQNAFSNLSFSGAVYLTHADDNTNRIFVIEQAGRIKVFPNSPTVLSTKEYLNITDRVSSGGEKGLLGLAFHSDYESNGYFYVNYTYTFNDTLKTRISRFQVTNNPDSADKNSEFQILTFSQPYSNHNGGWTGFGPNDGYLYIGTGDGGSGGDPQNNAQNITNLLGKILRIDVDGGTPYSIPATNPFFDSTGSVRKEIYAWGLRNPWRCSFDSVTGKLWAGDVGQNVWEEIDIIENGKNYGWRCYEGNHTYNTSGCNYPEYIYPVWEYPHNPECSITGGYVYRGVNVPELIGKYIYGDYCSRKIWSLEYDGITPPTNQLLVTAPGSITSFGVDQNNEIYVTSSNGNIYDFTPTTFQLSVSIADGWNILSVPLLAPDMTASTLFPTAISPFYEYDSSYNQVSVLENGNGYWAKFNGNQSQTITGTIVSNNQISVVQGWNLVGPFEYDVPVNSIATIPPNIITSPFYGYEIGYVIADTLKVGKGYWIKTNTSGIIQMNEELD